MPSEKTGNGGGDASAVSTYQPIRNATEFQRTARMIFGVGHVGKLARAMGKSESMVSRWINEQQELPFYACSLLAAWKLLYDERGIMPPEKPR